MAIASWMPKQNPPRAPYSDKYSGYPAGAGGAAGGAGAAGGSGGMSAGGSGYQKMVNPWEAAMKANYAAAAGPVPYKQQWQQGVGQAMTLGNRDYEGALRGFAQEDVQRQITSADNQLGSMGMRELALRGDVQADRSKARADASTRAMIDSQGIKSNAIETMRGMLGSASGVELDRIGQMINAAQAGGSNYIAFTDLAAPIQEKLGAASKAAQAARNAASLEQTQKIAAAQMAARPVQRKTRW